MEQMFASGLVSSSWVYDKSWFGLVHLCPLYLVVFWQKKSSGTYSFCLSFHNFLPNILTSVTWDQQLICIIPFGFLHNLNIKIFYCCRWKQQDTINSYGACEQMRTGIPWSLNLTHHHPTKSATMDSQSSVCGMAWLFSVLQSTYLRTVGSELVHKLKTHK